jgi:hypothetical protein
MLKGNLSGNGFLPYFIEGGGGASGEILNCVPLPPQETEKHKNIKPINRVRLTGRQSVLLACLQFSGTLLTLPNGDSVFLPCPISENASLTSLSNADLLHSLPKGTTFASGLDLQVILPATPGLFSADSANAETSTATSEAMTISFVIPADQLNANLALLYWDGGQWKEINSVVVNGHLNAQVDFDGTFIMVSK